MSSAFLSRPLSACGLSVRSYNCLTGAGIETLGDLLLWSPEALLAISGFGVTSLQDVGSSLSVFGLNFGMVLDSSGVPVPGSGVPPALVATGLVPKSGLVADHSVARDISLISILGDSGHQLTADAERYSGHPVAPGLLRLMEGSVVSVTSATGMKSADLVRHLSDLVESVLTPSSRQSALIREIVSATTVASDRDRVVATAYYGLDGSAGATLESIGSGMGITRERVRQLVSRFDGGMRMIRPPLPWAAAAYGCLESAEVPLSLTEWNSRLPRELRLPRAHMLLMYRQPEQWGWLPSISWLQIDGDWLVLPGAGRDSELKAFTRARRDLLRDALSWGAANADDLAMSSGWTRAAVVSALASEPAWTNFSRNWYVRSDGDGGVLGQRTIRMLRALGDLHVDDVRIGLRRLARRPHRDHPRKRVPPSVVLLALFDRMGLERGDPSEVLRGQTDPGHGSVGTDAAILAAFSSGTTAITVFELDDAIVAHGLSKASARVATSYSPLIRRVEYGVYALAGRRPVEVDVQRARSAVLTRTMEFLKEYEVESTGVIRLVYQDVSDVSRPLVLPYNTVPTGWWSIVEGGEERRVRVRERYMTGMGSVLRRGEAVGRTRVELHFDSVQRIITYQLVPRRASGQAHSAETDSTFARRLRILNQ